MLHIRGFFYRVSILGLRGPLASSKPLSTVCIACSLNPLFYYHTLPLALHALYTSIHHRHHCRRRRTPLKLPSHNWNKRAEFFMEYKCEKLDRQEHTEERGHERANTGLTLTFLPALLQFPLLLDRLKLRKMATSAPKPSHPVLSYKS